MATSTTIKIPEKLKSRINSLAKAAGKTPHAFMLDALESQADLAEQRKKFIAVAHSAEQQVAAYGLVHDADQLQHRPLALHARIERGQFGGLLATQAAWTRV